ncbi:MAG: cupin domain-containing protein [Methanomassiliicoccales archaeon]|jgi:glucose-6-phosphate isomerase|nr:cupin domain-containing protein [Methanomassiliicoccales archaeon]
MEMIFQYDLATRTFEGLRHWERRLSEMAEVFVSKEAVAEILKVNNPIIYEVWEVPNVPEKIGQLFWSFTILYPGKVGNEYYMTKGHYHLDPACAEVYLILLGEGVLLLKDNNASKALFVRKGSVAHIPPGCAHRMVNIGNEPLIFFAVYPAQAGHDYERIKEEGFTIRVIQRGRKPEVCQDR